MSRGKLDKLERAVLRKRDKNVPRDLWSQAEVMYEAYYLNNGSCPSTAGTTVGSFQVTERRKLSEIPNRRNA